MRFRLRDLVYRKTTPSGDVFVDREGNELQPVGGSGGGESTPPDVSALTTQVADLDSRVTTVEEATTPDLTGLAPQTAVDTLDTRVDDLDSRVAVVEEAVAPPPAAPTPGDPGIIAADRSAVAVTASGQHPSGSYNAVNATDGTSAMWVAPADSGAGWLRLDLGNGRAAKVHHWAIKTRSDVSAHNPRSFKLQGSNDGGTWTDLDVHVDDPTVSGIATWFIFSANNATAYRYFRFFQTKDDDEGTVPTPISTNLTEIELYGALV